MKRTLLKNKPFKSKPYQWKRKPKKATLKDTVTETTNLKESKTEESNRIREEEKQHFIQMGITSCELRLEGCWVCPNFSDGWSFAHSLKRSKITAKKINAEERDRQMREIIYACRHCHNVIEYPKTHLNYLTKFEPKENETAHEIMYRIVTTVIANRKR